MPRKPRPPYLVPNKAGVYEIRWTVDGRSKRRNTGETTLLGAEKALGKFLLNRKEEVRRQKNPNCVDCLDAYWYEHVLVNVVGKSTQMYAIEKLQRHFEGVFPHEVTQEHVDDYVARRVAGSLGHPSKTGTIRRELGVLMAACNHAARRKRINKQDVPFISLPASGPPRDRVLSKDEANRLITEAYRGSAPESQPRIYTFIMLMMETASRPTAVQELRWEQVDIENRLITFNPKGRKQTKKRRVPVPISDRLMKVLTKAYRLRDNDYVLGHSGSTRSAFKRVCRNAGLEDVTPYTLRHTWATWAAQRGETMLNIAAILGDSVKTVSENYIHHTPGYLRSTVEF